MTIKQRKALSYALAAALAASVYFFRDYFYIIALGAIIAYLFNPAFKWFYKVSHGRRGFAISMTFILSVITVTIPIALILIITTDQALQFADVVSKSFKEGTTAGNIFQNIIDSINNLIAKLPGGSIDPISATQIFDWLKSNISSILQNGVGLVAGAANGFTTFLTKAVIYVFVFISILRNQDKIIRILRKINPLGEQATDLYLSRMGLMTSAMVKGQFVIAFAQGLIDAALLWVVGVDYFFLWLVVVTFLSIIPLGGGVLVIPVGIVMLLTGNIWQGIVLIAGHILIVTNVDNILRPRFVPKRARLDSALVILSVFAGIAMFGFLGIVIGPVLMIMIVTTLQVYLAAVDHEAALSQTKELTE